MNSDNSYYGKYLKYKNKYLDLKQKISGGSGMPVNSFSMPEQVERIRIQVTSKIVEIGEKIQTGETINLSEIDDQLNDIDRVLEQSRTNSEFYQYLLNVFKELIENKDDYSGFTIHYVNENYDEGDIIFQKKIKIRGSNAEDLAKEILKLEHDYYPKIIFNLLNG